MRLSRIWLRKRLIFQTCALHRQKAEQKSEREAILLYIDEDSMDEDFVQALRSRNVDVLTGRCGDAHKM